jgi:Cu(I)/Ag(I) efflux system membrane protein CusA/SilA
VPPIRNRIDMLSTGIKSPIGIKVSGTQLHVADGHAVAGRLVTLDINVEVAPAHQPLG